ncbi:MAG: hypothetical protein JWO03_2510, partial [Bacteroidetes bacterium]|nr:hypothetical protein [Bacteroidota bacterium]
MRKLSTLFRITFLFAALLLAGLRSYSQTITGNLSVQYTDDSHITLHLFNPGGTAWSTNCPNCIDNTFFSWVADAAFHRITDSFTYLGSGINGIDPKDTFFIGPQTGTFSARVGTIMGSRYCGGACYLYNSPNQVSVYGTFPLSSTIAPPDQLNATVDALPPVFQGGKLTWHKKSALPDSLLKYIIYRDLTVLDTIASTDTIMSYTDNTLLTSGFYGYRVMSYTPGGTTREGFTWPAQYSPVSSSPIGYINMPDMHLLTASNGVAQGRTDLSWPNMSAYSPNGIAILRNGQQLTVLNRFQTTYSDYTGVPGVPYQYAIAAIADDGTTPYRFTDTGYAKPNGTISGSVKSPLGSGVQGVLITATSIVDGISHTDTAVTDAIGKYTLRQLYYDSAATFTLRASRDSDFFTPASITQRLDIQNYSVNVSDFIDTTVFTIRGHVNFADIGSFHNLPLQGATLYVNGLATSILTNSSGAYAYTASSIGDYDISFRYLGHAFDHASQLVHVPGPNMGSVDFRDMKRDTLTIDLRSTCHSRIVDNATINVTSYPNPIIDSFASFDGTHPTLLVLPGTT